MRTFLFPALAGLALVACDQLTEPQSLEAETPPVIIEDVDTAQPIETPQPDAPAPSNVAERKTATIDWNAARADFAARDTDDGGMAQVASGGAPVVPVLLPEEPFGIASTGGEDALQFRPLTDGYFAVKKGDIYDMVINGTDRLVARPEGSGSAIDTELDFEETMTGAQVSFSRYGASYLVEFMCNDPATAIKGSCVTEAEAIAEVEKLLIAGTR
ncbi:MAG: hypothetical protein AAF331_11350 [Pseudomonadota bacterium]